MSERTELNAEVARSLWDGASSGDPDAMLRLASDVVWRTYGTGANAGEYRGIDEVLKYLAMAGKRMDAMRSELLDVFASERGAAILYHSEFRRGDQTFDCRYFMSLRIVEGVIVEVAVVPWDQAQAEAFFRSH